MIRPLTRWYGRTILIRHNQLHDFDLHFMDPLLHGLGGLLCRKKAAVFLYKGMP